MEKVEPWSSKYRTSYKKGDLVSYNDTIYVAVGANQNCGIPGSIPDLVVYVSIESQFFLLQFNLTNIVNYNS
jgi:hypothetical protein